MFIKSRILNNSHLIKISFKTKIKEIILISFKSTELFDRGTLIALPNLNSNEY